MNRQVNLIKYGGFSFNDVDNLMSVSELDAYFALVKQFVNYENEKRAEAVEKARTGRKRKS
mgnify:CR=1 FL=1